jgi:hypothetical protein
LPAGPTVRIRFPPAKSLRTIGSIGSSAAEIKACCERGASWFEYPRSAALVCLIGLSQTSGVGLALWASTLSRLLLKITPAEASYLMIWVAVSAFVGRIVCMWPPHLIGRRISGMLACLGGVATLIIAGYLADAYIGSVSVFWLMLMVHSFFGGGSYTGPTSQLDWLISVPHPNMARTASRGPPLLSHFVC